MMLSAQATALHDLQEQLAKHWPRPPSGSALIVACAVIGQGPAAVQIMAARFVKAGEFG